MADTPACTVADGQTQTGRRSSVELALAALVIALILGVGLILPLPFWRTRPPSPPPPGQPLAEGLGWPAALLAIGLALVLCLPYRPYLQALRLATRVSSRTLVLLSGGLAIVGLLIYPAYGGDLFVYLDYERLWTVYGANPLLASPNLQPADWAFRFVWIPEQPSPYGPLWPILTWPIAWLAGDSLWGWIVGYKLLALVSYVACCGLIWLNVEPDRRKHALMFFAWSPLVLFDLLGKAHNDGLLAASALAAVWLARRNAAGGMLVAAAGVLVKLSGTGVMAGLGVSWLRARAWRQLGFASVAAAALCAALYAPFWVGPATLAPVLFQTHRVVWSPGALLIAVLGSGADIPARIVTALAWLGVAVLVLRRRPDTSAADTMPQLAQDAAILLLATLLLLTTAFFAHYLVPVIALSAVAGNRRLGAFTVALSIGALAAYAVELLAPALPAGWIGSRGYQALGSLLVLVPAVLTWLAPLAGRIATRRKSGS